MAENKLTDWLLAAEKPYRPAESLELPPSKACGAYVIKCEECAFLLIEKEGWRFLDETAGTSLAFTDALSPAQDLDGWRADMAYAPGKTAVCDFEAGVLACGEERMPVRVSALRPNLFLVAGNSPRFVLILDTARFLFYGGAEGHPFGGYIRNMPQDR